MNIIIQLTATSNTAFYVNANNIETFYQNGIYTAISFTSGETAEVTQTPAQVLAAIVAL